MRVSVQRATKASENDRGEHHDPNVTQRFRRLGWCADGVALHVNTAVIDGAVDRQRGYVARACHAGIHRRHDRAVDRD